LYDAWIGALESDESTQRLEIISVAVDFRLEDFAWVTFVPRCDARASSFFS
jgi:hypothetical protein